VFGDDVIPARVTTRDAAQDLGEMTASQRTIATMKPPAGPIFHGAG
jgi:hypothetical protein